MDTVRSIEEMSDSELLDHVDDLATAQRRCELEILKAAVQHAVVVCDRSALDNYAYMALACGRHKPVERFVDWWMKTYDLLFKVPLAGAASADGFRDTDEFFMRSIDELVDRLLVERRLTCERLPEGRREEWPRLAVEAVLRHPHFAKLF